MLINRETSTLATPRIVLLAGLSGCAESICPLPRPESRGTRYWQLYCPPLGPHHRGIDNREYLEHQL